MRTKPLAGILLLLALGLLLSSGAQADVVGRLTQVEGRVDLLKGGQLPATPVKINDGVQTGDVIRTKSLSKAQITFIDNSTLTVSPESRVGIEAYMFDSAQNKRNAVIQLFQGLALVVVNKVLKSAEPDFVVKTHTAIMGVRGTEFGIRIHPNSSTILNFEGVLQVGNIFPEVGQLSQRALKVAYSFGPPGSSNSVLLRDRQGTMVGRGIAPTMPFPITEEDWKVFKHQVGGGLITRKGGRDSGGGGTGGGSSSVEGSAGTEGTFSTDSLSSKLIQYTPTAVGLDTAAQAAAQAAARGSGAGGGTGGGTGSGGTGGGRGSGTSGGAGGGPGSGPGNGGTGGGTGSGGPGGGGTSGGTGGGPGSGGTGSG